MSLHAHRRLPVHHHHRALLMVGPGTQAPRVPAALAGRIMAQVQRGLTPPRLARVMPTAARFGTICVMVAASANATTAMHP